MRTPATLKAAIAALLMPGAAVQAAQITTTTAVPGEPAAVLVRAHRLDKRADVIEKKIQLPGVSTLSLHEGVWEIGVESGSYWAPRVYARDGDSVTLPVWPAVPLRGTAKGVTKLGVAFTPLGAGGPAGETECSLDGESWTCAIPPGQYDLRFFTRGSAPEFRWGVAAPGRLEDPLRFVAGASLSGRVEAVRGARIRLDGVEVLLSGAQQLYRATPNTKGFFQFKGLPSGQYSLRARREGLAAQARSVTIIAGAAAELNAPLLLDRPRRLTLTIAPALDPEMQPWHVSLWAHGGAGSEGGLTSVSESAAAPSGEWSMSGLVAGDYEVRIMRAGGGIWKAVNVTIGQTDVHLPLSVMGEQVRGVVTLGDRPIAAELSFGGEGGARLTSGDDGRFEGEIPPEDGDERTIHVHAAAMRVTRTVRVKIERTESGARMAIQLPATTLAGRVIGSDGAPKREVLIIVSSDRPGAVHQLFSEHDGSFHVAGIEPGEYRVSAENAYERSERVVVTLSDGLPAEVELLLRSRVIVRGRVRAGETPVMMADVYGIPRDTHFAPLMPQTKTNESGRFELRLPPRTTIFDLVVVHPAFDIVLTRVAEQIDSQRQIVATQMGGTLIVHAREPQDVVLRHAGGECWLYWLANISGVNGLLEPPRVILPRLEPGEYTVCSAKTKECTQGYLPPYGTLTVTLQAGADGK